jgi:RNA polymerase sigma-70 factor (ECF subfamily)
MERFRPDSDQTEYLLQQARAGNELAFDDLFARHRDYLLLVVNTRLDPRLRPRLDPEDVVQEAQLEAFRRFGDFLNRRPMSFRLWMRKTVCERLLMMQRYHRGAAVRSIDREVGLPDKSAFALVQQLFAASASPSRPLEQSEAARVIRDAMAKLSEIDREILLMRTLEGVSNKEVAEALQIDPGAASQRYSRALLRLHELLQESGFLEGQS